MNKPTSIVTACDDGYALSALNLVGSVRINSPSVQKVYVYDLGMSPNIRRLFDDIDYVELREVEPFCKHWKQCWGWKAWVWKDAPVDRFIYLDAGTEVLRDISQIAKIINKTGYFLVTQSEEENRMSLDDITPKNYYPLFNVSKSLAGNDIIAAGVIGFDKNHAFYKEVVFKMLKAVEKDFHLGWSTVEMGRNTGIHYLNDSPLRDCVLFRHDQTLLTLFAYAYSETIDIQPLEKYAGYKSASDHPDQVIWHHRRHSSLPYLDRIPYIKNALKHRLKLRLIKTLRSSN